MGYPEDDDFLNGEETPRFRRYRDFDGEIERLDEI